MGVSNALFILYILETYHIYNELDRQREKHMGRSLSIKASWASMTIKYNVYQKHDDVPFGGAVSLPFALCLKYDLKNLF